MLTLTGRLLTFLILFFMLLACPAKQIRTEDSVNPDSLVIEAARHFLTAFFQEDFEGVKKVTDVPFLMDNKAILNYPEEWTRVLRQVFEQRELKAVEILSLTLYTPEQVQQLNIRAWVQLVGTGFHKHLYVLARFRHPQSKIEEQILLIVKTDSDRQVKVVGFLN